MSEDEKILKEAKKLSWEDRLAHKNWKVRNDANIDLAALCETILDPKDPRLKEFGPLFKKAVSDSNAPAQEKALDAVIAYLKAADVDAARYAKEICDAIVGKCLTGRPKTIEKAQAVFLLWVELEAADIFLDAMEKAVKNKVAKAVVPAIDAMYQAISLFGTKVVPPKKILKMLPDLFDHQDQNVRACAKGLTIEMCRWIGKDIVKSILFEKMRDTMKKELEAEVDAVTGVSKPSRKIRSEQEKELEPEPVVECPQAGHMDDSSTGGSPNVDEYELVDPVDILTQLGKSTFWEGVKASKWSERRDAVAELTKLASVKRLGAGDYAEVCRTLKKLIMDVNIAVAVEAVQAAGNLARGLRKDFASGARLLLPLLLDKLKEKKQVMVDALSQTLQALHKGGCIQLLDIVEEVKVATKNKVPSVRSLCLTWLTFCIETSSKALVLKLHKDYVPILMECLTDGTPEVRDAAFSALAAVAKSVGMRPLERALEKLDEVRRKKLIEMIGSNGGGALSTSVPGRVGSAFPGASDEAVDAVPKKSAASLLSGKKLVSGTASSTKKSAPVRPSTAKKSDGVGKHMPAAEPLEDLEPGCMSLEEIEARVGSLLEMDVLFKLKSSNWKERLEAITGLKATVEGLDDVQQHAELLIRLISLLPGWSEKNVQVQQKAIEIITHIAQNSLFSKRCVVLCVAGVAERVCDVKTRLQATKCLTVFCESVGPQFVFDRLFKIIKDHKNPKVLSECVLWLVSAVDDFGVAQIKLKDLIDFCKDVGLQSSAAASRNATVKLIGIVHKFVGPDIKVFLSDVKPALQSALDTEYEKNPYEGPVSAPRRAVRAVDPDVLSAGGGSDSLPREDISGKLTASLLKNLSCPEWKVRQESIEAINRIIEESHRRIQVTGTGELFGALKGRLSDSNKNLIIMSLSTIGSLASAMGPAIEKSSKGILSDVLKCLSDNKKLVREAVVKTLDMWIMIVSLDKMLPCLMPTITDSKVCADGRRDLYEWLTRQIAKPANQLDLIQLVKPISQGLQDKSADVRRAAEACLIQMLTTSGADMVTKINRELQGTALAAVQPILERYKSPGATEEASQTMKGGKGLVIKSGKQVSIATGDRPPSRGGPAGPLRGSSKTPALKVTKQASAGAAHDAAVLGGQLLFHLKDSNKEERERLIPRKTKFEELRPDQIQDLENDMTKHFREDLHQKLLSPDFKKQVDGLELLQKAIPLHIKEITEVIDILLRWTVLRFCESNTTCLLKVLELLPELVEALKNEGYTLTEYESSVLLPCLVEKAGHNIEKVRERMRELMKALCCIYPASKVFMFVTEGLRSKNNRTRIECVDHIGDMIDRYGIEISGSTKVLQTIAALTTERDSEIRKAALQTLAVTYKILGEDIWKYVGKVSDAQKSILDDKFKWKAREMIKRKEGKPGEVRAAMRRSVRENGLETAEPSGEGCRPLTAPPVLPSARAGSGLVNSSADVTLIQHSSVHLSAPPGGPGDWNEALDIIEFGTTAEQFVEGMKLVCHELGQAVGDSESKALDDLGKDADRLVANLTLKVTVTFKLGLAGESSRSCKYVLNTLMQTFQVKKLAHEVKELTLHNLIKELLLWLLDERVPLMDDGSQLLKALNVLMLKILENANRTSAFMVLIYLLRPFDPTRASCSSAEEAMLLRGQKFSDLVVKCLIKLTKVLGSTIYEVDLDRLLQSIHEYLQELGLEEIRRRAGADDKPLRMVKTVLHELVKLRGTAIKGHLSMVPIDLEPQPIILAYIDLNLQTLAAARMLTPSAGTGQAHWTDPTSNGPPTPANQSAEAQLKQELAAVFKKIGDKQTSAIGLYELYRITQLYPQVDIFAQLQNASEAFRAYIRDGLEQMGKNATGRTPVSIAFVSPPPVSPPTHGFPKTAPASPSNSRLHPFGQEFISNNNVVGNYREELGVKKGANVRGFSGRHEDVASEADGIADGQAGGPAHGHAGTLDAIRERMKNIQAAAAGTTTGGFVSGHSNGTSDARSFLEQAMEGPGVEGGRTGSAPAMDEKALSGLQERMARLKSSSVETFNPGWV